MNKKIIFALTLYSALNAAENPHAFLPLSNCQDLIWLQNGIILMNASSKNPVVSQESIQGIFSIDTHNNDTQLLYSFNNEDRDNYRGYHITPNQDKTIAFISLPIKSYIYQDGNITIEETLKTERRPVILDANKIIIINKNNLCDIYDGTDIKPATQLNAAIKQMERDTDFGHKFNNQIAKNPTMDEYLLSSRRDIFTWNVSSNELKLIHLPDLAITPIDMYISPYDIQYHSNGTHVAVTYDAPYNCWILNLLTQKLLVLKHKKENELVEKLRKQYEDNPTPQNGHDLINAAWNAQFYIDSKAFHPTLAVIATLTKNKARLKYWNILTGEKITKQTLPFKSNYQPHGCLPRLLAFSPDGKQIACGLDQGLVILDVPVLAIK